MKRKLMVGVMTLCSIFCITGCNEPNEPSNNYGAEDNICKIHSQYFDAEIIETQGDCSYIIRDKNTNVLYVVVGGYYSSIMTPIFNKDGTLKTYKGVK